MADVLAIFGISGVGKSWLASRLAAKLDLRHVQAGDLLREARREIDGHAPSAEQLRTGGAVLDNQALLLQAFSTVRRIERRDIVFDGHSVVDTDSGLLEIPVAVVRGIGPSTVAFVHDDPEKIAARRLVDDGRARPRRSAAELREHQQRALAVCNDYRDALAIPLYMVRSGDLAALERVAASVLRKPRNAKEHR